VHLPNITMNYDDDFRNNRDGTVTVVNLTDHDMLLFVDGINRNNIVGAARANGSRTLNFSGESDYAQGGAELLRAVRQSEFEAHGNQSRMDDSTVIKFGRGAARASGRVYAYACFPARWNGG